MKYSGSSEPPVKDETASHTQQKTPKPQSKTKPTISQTMPSEDSSEPVMQESLESVDDCIAYGKEYALSIGLDLDNTATDCWDTPITTSDPLYLKRDLRDRLDWYSVNGFTAVCLWKEYVNNGQYEIYIGYA